MASVDAASIPAEAYLLADHCALDLLNTEARVAGKSFDFWSTSNDVLRWLHRSGFLDAPAELHEDMPQLIEKARELRAIARELVEQRKQGLPGNTDRLNAFLCGYARYPVLSWNSAEDLRLAWQPAARSEAQLLGAVAEAVAKLLAEADFSLVRQCEDPDCTMWFYDKTKSHRRRWCSMALCGNRQKVAAYRKRIATAS